MNPLLSIEISYRAIKSNKTKSLNRITVFVDPTYDLAYAQGEIEKTLRRQHGIKDEMDDDFFVRTQQAQINPIEALRYE